MSVSFTDALWDFNCYNSVLHENMKIWRIFQAVFTAQRYVGLPGNIREV